MLNSTINNKDRSLMFNTTNELVVGNNNNQLLTVFSTTNTSNNTLELDKDNHKDANVVKSPKVYKGKNQNILVNENFS